MSMMVRKCRARPIFWSAYNGNYNFTAGGFKYLHPVILCPGYVLTAAIAQAQNKGQDHDHAERRA